MFEDRNWATVKPTQRGERSAEVRGRRADARRQMPDGGDRSWRLGGRCILGFYYQLNREEKLTVSI